MSEARITINDVTLTEAQSMTVRVALEAFASELAANDEVGDIAALYLERIKEIRRLL